MKIIVDTNILLYLLFDGSKLTKREREIIQDVRNEIIVSSISLFEISLKYSIKRLELFNITPDRLPDLLLKNGYTIEDVDYLTFATYYKLPNDRHKDPFDRLLIWESIRKNFYVLTKDREFKKYVPFGLKII